MFIKITRSCAIVGYYEKVDHFMGSNVAAGHYFGAAGIDYCDVTKSECCDWYSRCDAVIMAPRGASLERSSVHNGRIHWFQSTISDSMMVDMHDWRYVQCTWLYV